MQIYIRLHSDLKDFGSETDQQAAKSLLANFRKMVVESGEHLLDSIIRDLSDLTNVSDLHIPICSFSSFHFRMVLSKQ